MRRISRRVCELDGRERELNEDAGIADVSPEGLDLKSSHAKAVRIRYSFRGFVIRDFSEVREALMSNKLS